MPTACNNSPPATISLCRGIKLIAPTGYGLEEDRQRRTAAGFDKHLTKPLKIKDLNETLKALLKG